MKTWWRMKILGILLCTWTVICVTSQRWKVSDYHAQKRLLSICRYKKPTKVQRWKSSARDITYARHSQHVQLKVSLNLMFFQWDWSWTTTQITFMTEMLCTLLLIHLILFLNIYLQLWSFFMNCWATKILINIRRTIQLPLKNPYF